MKKIAILTKQVLLLWDKGGKRYTYC